MVAFDPSRSFFPDPMLVEFGDVAHQGHAFADMFPDFCLPFAEYGINFRERSVPSSSALGCLDTTRILMDTHLVYQVSLRRGHLPS
jgi:hypothetical protein